MITKHRHLLLWLSFWCLIIVAITVFQSGFYNPDSFKYVSIATSMLAQHHYILPIYDGHPYSDKGPLMFWLFILGWKITGINQWWPQLLIGLTATASIFLTLKIGDALWPKDHQLKRLLPFIQLGMPSWIVLSSEIRADIFLMLFCLSGLLSLIMSFRGQKIYWILFGLSLVFGFLCKGPVILIYTTVPALFFPFIFGRNSDSKLLLWYLDLVLINLAAIGLALLWAVPAAIKGGHTFSHQLFFSQVYDRAFQDYSFFYYVIRLPLFLLPWILYVPFIVGGLKYSRFQSAERFCWLVIIISIVVFSFYGQKRVHYLNPDFPLFALLIARAISNYMQVHALPKLWHQWFISLILLSGAGAILALPHLSISLNPALQAQFFHVLKYNRLIAGVLVILSAFYLLYHPKTFIRQLMLIMVPTAFIATSLLILRVTP